jgi:membrane protein implicated in regulation of membrane protease activity
MVDNGALLFSFFGGNSGKMSIFVLKIKPCCIILPTLKKDTQMKEFFTSMETAETIYWAIALTASLIFIILSVLSFVGGADVDAVVDVDAHLGDMEAPSHIISFRNVINFLLGFGWTGVAFYHQISSQILLALLAIVVGIIFVAIFTLIFRSFLKMQENNAFKIEDTVGKIANVYIRIPASRASKGKIQISVNGSVHELDAITDHPQQIESGKTVLVKSIEGTALIVEPQQG